MCLKSKSVDKNVVLKVKHNKNVVNPTLCSSTSNKTLFKAQFMALNISYTLKVTTIFMSFNGRIEKRY